MRAVVHDRYGPPEVLRVGEVERPVPKDDEVLVRVHATTVTRTDCHMRAASPVFWRFTAELPSFEKQIQPLLAKYCIECHGPEKQKGELRLDQLSRSFDPSVTAKWRSGGPRRTQRDAAER